MRRSSWQIGLLSTSDPLTLAVDVGEMPSAFYADKLLLAEGFEAAALSVNGEPVQGHDGRPFDFRWWSERRANIPAVLRGETGIFYFRRLGIYLALSMISLKDATTIVNMTDTEKVRGEMLEEVFKRAVKVRLP